ncbi:MAG: hypothetical protein AB7V42_07690 [Thermoleophilia bacterium]
MRPLISTFAVACLVMVAAGVAGLVWALRMDGPGRLGLLIGCAAILGAGAAFGWGAVHLDRVDGSRLRARGIAARATLLEVTDTGTTIAGIGMVARVRARIDVAGREPYEATSRVALGRMNWGTLRPGMTVPVRVDRSRPGRFTIDR